jgi:hypothetical protein
MPRLGGSKEENQITEVLTGKRPVQGLHIHGRVDVAYRPSGRAGLLGVFRPLRPVDWLRHAGGLSQMEAEAIVARLGLKPQWRLNQLPGTSKTLLGVEAAWARGADVVIFSTAGLDPLGTQEVFRAVAAKLEKGAAIHLCYPFLQNGQEKRECFPGGPCIELLNESGSAASLSPA